jgi:DNA-binding NarL/FixJ family response regulator
MAGALKNESSVLKSLFQLNDLHPALERIFMERATPVNELGQPASGTEIAPISSSPYIPLNQRKPNIFNVLTDRELEILTLTTAGYTAAECAAKTGSEPGTVSVHRQKIKAKAEQFAGEKGKPK